MSLNFFKLRKALPDIFFHLYLDSVGNRRQLIADVGADSLDALLRLGGERRNLELERSRLLPAAGRKMLFQGSVEVEESFRQAIGGREAEGALRLLQASGEVGAGLG